jgi:hypothetical protein
MKLFIPEIGDSFVLAKDWTFTLYSEYRNKAMFEALGIEYGNSNRYRGDLTETEVTIPKNTVLSVDRIYIRKGNQEYSSLTFYASGTEQFKKKVRFWAKLSDVNNIEFKENVIIKTKKKPKVEIHRSWDPNKPRSYNDTILGSWNYSPIGRNVDVENQNLPTYVAYVDNKDSWFKRNADNAEVRIEFLVVYRELSTEERKNLYRENFRNRFSVRPKMVEETHQITEFKATAIENKTNTVIGSAKTQETLKKKIKEYYANKND